ncbi:YjeF N-terminal domain-containing protein [Dipodascopsis tothii]|uniref:YjeF N-terminal domain-containing protein n=1 Tax=Dipodascopsis tothii TaxID=44089 RepID=UPI0034CDCC50
MAEFTGFRVLVKLHNGTEVQGVVTSIVGTDLQLSNVYIPLSKRRLESFSINGSLIADLEIIAATDAPVLQDVRPPANGAAAPVKAAFVDPAILSFEASREATPAADGEAKKKKALADRSADSDQLATPTKQRGDKFPPHGRSKSNNTHSNANTPAHQRRRTDNGDSGWATGDITDFKNTEFDFQGNLDRFDKKTVFDEIRLADSTPAAERLVAFNKKQQTIKDDFNTVGLTERLGKLGLTREQPRKDYKPKENVLESYATALELRGDGWEGIADDVSSVSTDTCDTPAPAPQRRSRPYGQPPASGARFYIKATKTVCPVLSSESYTALEQATMAEYAITDTQLCENAGRAVSAVAMQALGGPRRISSSNHNSFPVVVMLIGKCHRTGARALAAGRQLVNHHVRVVACVTRVADAESDELAALYRAQLKAFRYAGGRTTKPQQLAKLLSALDSPPELIVDALCGHELRVDELWGDDLANVVELVDWANQQKAQAMSLDIPAGLDPETGRLAEVGRSLNVKWVVALGVPKRGLLDAAARQASAADNDAGWQISLGDIGLPRAGFRHLFGAATKAEMTGPENETDGALLAGGIPFGCEWLVGLDVRTA